MQQGTRICKVCGAEYPYCKTFRPSSVFRYQDVACCPEHGALYFERIMSSRESGTDTSPAPDVMNTTMVHMAQEDTDPMFIDEQDDTWDDEDDDEIDDDDYGDEE